MLGRRSPCPWTSTTPPPTATVKKAGGSAIKFKVATIQLPLVLGDDAKKRVLLVDNTAASVDGRYGDMFFNGAALLHVFGAVPSVGGAMYVTTVPISEK